MKRNRPQSLVIDAIDALHRDHDLASDRDQDDDEEFRTLTERLRAGAVQTAASGAVVVGLAEDQIEFVRDSHFGLVSHRNALHDGVVDQLGIHDPLHEWVPGTALLVIAAIAVHKLRSGESRSAVIDWVKEQAMMAGAANGVATIASILTGHELVRLPAALMTRFWIARADVSGAAHRRAQETRKVLRDRLDWQVLNSISSTGISILRRP